MCPHYQTVVYMILKMAFLFAQINNSASLTLKCGSTSAVKYGVVERFRLNNYRLCEYQIEPYGQRVHQLYLSLSFKLSQPTVPAPDNNLTVPECQEEYLKIANYTFCGVERLQKIYIPFGHSVNVSSIKISVALRGKNVTTDNLREQRVADPALELIIIQIDADCLENSTDCQPDPMLSAPSGCLQYHTSDEGFIKSFNYNNGQGIYPAGMEYTICIRKSEHTWGLRLKFLKFGLRHHGDLQKNESRSCNLTQDYLMIPKNFILSFYQVLEDLPVVVEDNYICEDDITNRTIFCFNFEGKETGVFRMIFRSQRNYTENGSGFLLKYTALNQLTAFGERPNFLETASVVSKGGLPIA